MGWEQPDIYLTAPWDYNRLYSLFDHQIDKIFLWLYGYLLVFKTNQWKINHPLLVRYGQPFFFTLFMYLNIFLTES